MPPKAKVKAKAKAKAPPIRRPAALRRRAHLRRPAQAVGEQSPWQQGLAVKAREVPLGEFVPGSCLVAEEADYFGAHCKVAGEIRKLEVDQGDTYVQLRVKGTDSEALLRAHTSQPQTLFRCHICREGCGRQVVGEYTLHLVKVRQMKAQGEEGWVSNLESTAGEGEADELARLRQRSAALERQEQEGGPPPVPKQGGPPGDQQQEASQDRAKKKEKKVKKKSKDVDDGRNPAAAAQKEVKELFRGTGLDPREKVRRRVQKRAQKLVSRKRGKGSSRSSGSSSSSSSPTQEEPRGVDGVFAEDTKVRAVAERYPGALTVEAIAAMKRSLLTTSGEDMDDSSVKPIAVLYFRTVLAKRTSGAQSREMLNLSAALDLLIRGKPACAADLIAQRLKAQEAVSQGTAWPVAQKLEIPPADQPGLVARAELASARKEEFEEARTRWRAQAAGSGKADNKGKSKGGRGDSNPWRRDDRKDENKDKKGKGQDKKGG